MAKSQSVRVAASRVLLKLWRSIAFSIRLLWNLILALATEERCRLCTRYIDILGWLNEVTAADTVSPAYLEHLNATSAAICHTCWHSLLLNKPIVSRYSVDDTKQLHVYSGIGYTESMKTLVRRFKYDKDLLLTKPFCSLLLREGTNIERADNLILVPVPLHWRRKHERGYNQSALVATAIGKQKQIPVVEKALSRRKMTEPQNKLTKEARQDNLTNAFRGNEKLLRNKNVVLIDDVCTSGATLLECTREIYRCGASSVLGLTVARAVLIHQEVENAEPIDR